VLRWCREADPNVLCVGDVRCDDDDDDCGGGDVRVETWLYINKYVY